MGTFLYFAYASNMLTKRIRLKHNSPVRKCIGKLNAYRLDFMHYSRRWGGATATIVPSEGSTVWGVVWELNNNELESLDEQELYQNLYLRHQVEIECNNEKYLCETYRQIEPPELVTVLPDDRKPSDVYKNCIVQGAIENGLPRYYIDNLGKLPVIPAKESLNLSKLFAQ